MRNADAETADAPAERISTRPSMYACNRLFIRVADECAVCSVQIKGESVTVAGIQLQLGDLGR